MGKKIAELCLSNNIDKVCFDRGGNIYHGRVQVCLPAARLLCLALKAPATAAFVCSPDASPSHPVCCAMPFPYISMA